MSLTLIGRLVERVLTCLRRLAELSIARHVDVATSIELGNREQKQGLKAGIWSRKQEQQGEQDPAVDDGKEVDSSSTTKRRREIGVVERKNGFKEKEKEVEVEVDFLSPSKEMRRKRRGEGRSTSVDRKEEGIQGEGRGRFLVAGKGDGKKAKRRREINIGRQGGRSDSREQGVDSEARRATQERQVRGRRRGEAK
ncbi:hypothetical protein ACLOJK_030010 [Asimina triloba]